MAFWGVEVEPGKPFTLKATEATEIRRRLHLSQATLVGLGNGRNILVCNVGNRRPLYLCVLCPEKFYSCPLNLEFEEADDVIFSVIGPFSIHITGYFLDTTPTAFRLNDDETLARADDVEVGNNDNKIPKVLSSESPLPSKSLVVVNSNDEALQISKKPATDKKIKPSSDVIHSQQNDDDATRSKKKRKRDQRETMVLGRRDRSDYPLPKFYESLYKLVDDPSSDSIISWSKSNKSFVIRNQEKFLRRKIYSRFFCSTFKKFISSLTHYGFIEIKRSDGLLKFGNENFVRGQPELMKEMHIRTVRKRINKDLME